MSKVKHLLESNVVKNFPFIKFIHYCTKNIRGLNIYVGLSCRAKFLSKILNTQTENTSTASGVSSHPLISRTSTTPSCGGPLRAQIIRKVCFYEQKYDFWPIRTRYALFKGTPKFISFYIFFSNKIFFIHCHIEPTCHKFSTYGEKWRAPKLIKKRKFKIITNVKKHGKNRFWRVTRRVLCPSP